MPHRRGPRDDGGLADYGLGRVNVGGRRDCALVLLPRRHGSGLHLPRVPRTSAVATSCFATESRPYEYPCITAITTAKPAPATEPSIAASSAPAEDAALEPTFRATVASTRSTPSQPAHTTTEPAAESPPATRHRLRREFYHFGRR